MNQTGGSKKNNRGPVPEGGKVGNCGAMPPLDCEDVGENGNGEDLDAFVSMMLKMRANKKAPTNVPKKF